MRALALNHAVRRVIPCNFLAPPIGIALKADLDALFECRETEMRLSPIAALPEL